MTGAFSFLRQLVHLGRARKNLCKSSLNCDGTRPTRFKPDFWKPGAPGRHRRKLSQEILHNEAGATAIEYGLIAAGISVAIIAIVNGIGTKLATAFQTARDELK
jgi:pilus assembly protein Flp/PilA